MIDVGLKKELPIKTVAAFIPATSAVAPPPPVILIIVVLDNVVLFSEYPKPPNKTPLLLAIEILFNKPFVVSPIFPS